MTRSDGLVAVLAGAISLLWLQPGTGQQSLSATSAKQSGISATPVVNTPRTPAEEPPKRPVAGCSEVALTISATIAKHPVTAAAPAVSAPRTPVVEPPKPPSAEGPGDTVTVAATTAKQPSMGATPAVSAPRRPAEEPPKPPVVDCSGDTLTISAQNATLASVLDAIRDCTGAEIIVPDGTGAERVFAEFGPGPVRAVVADLLSSMDFNYAFASSPSDPQRLETVLVNPGVNDLGTAVASAPPKPAKTREEMLADLKLLYEQRKQMLQEEQQQASTDH